MVTSRIGPASHWLYLIARNTQGNKTGWIQRKKEMERKHGLRFGILNVGTFHQKSEEVVEMMKERKIDVLGISETRDKQMGKEIIHDGYLYIRSGSPSGKHGVGIILKTDVGEYIHNCNYVNNRIVKLSIRTRHQKLSVVQIYAPQQGRTTDEKEEFYETLQATIDTCPPDEQIIVMGDFNGHVGTDRTGYEENLGHFHIGGRNEEGKRLLELCVRNNMKVMNTYFQHKDSHKYTWYGWNREKCDYDRKTIIDYFLSNSSRSISDVKVIPSISLDSDHRLVIMKTKILPHKKRQRKKIKRVNIKNMNDQTMLSFYETMNKNDHEHDDNYEEETMEDSWKKIKETIHQAIEKSTGFKYSTTTRKKKTPWWTEEVKKAVKEKTGAFRRWMKERTPETREVYEAKRNSANRVKTETKQLKWKQLCDDLEKDLQGNKKLIYQLAKSYRKGRSEKADNIKDMNNGEILTNPEDINHTWKQYFSSLLNHPIKEETTYVPEPPTEQEVAELRDEMINIEEVETAIASLKNGKSPGSDLIPNEILKWGKPLLTTKLSELFTKAYRTGTIPEDWGKSIICPIYKNKGDHQMCANYRGISLMNHTAKLYEIILERRLKQHAEVKLGEWQHGFRPGKSTTDMIFAIKRMMDKHWEYAKPLYIAFLDLEKAFDRVPRDRLWEMLEKYQIPYHLRRAVRSTYNTSISKVSTGVGDEVWFETTTGVRQGSILSPLLFILYLDQVIHEVAKEQPVMNVLAYADDIAQLDSSEQDLQEHLNKWHECFTKYGLKLNIQKTEVVVLARSRINTNTSLNNQTIKQVSTFKYLGSTISEDGLIDHEIIARIKKFSQNVGFLYRLLKDKNVPKKVKKIILVGILRPILLYGSETWTISKNNMKKITAADMKVVRMINGVTKMDKIRNVNLCARLKIPLIAEKVKSSQLKWYGHVMRRSDDHPASQALNFTIKSTRPTGRPRKRWLQYIDDYLQERGTSLQKVNRSRTYDDRDEWRKIADLFPN